MRRAFPIATALFGAMLVSTAAAHAQTLDEIIAKNLEAKGGVQKITATSAVKMVGKIRQGTAGGEIKMTTYAKRPNLMRQEAEVSGRKMIMIFDGTNGWRLLPDGSSQQAPPGPQLEAMKQQAEFDGIFLTYKTQGHKIELVGTEKADGKTLHHLKVTRKEGPIHHYYVDADTGLEAKFTISVDTTQVETRLEDYREVDGRMVPFKLTQYANGTKMGETQLESVEFNPPLDESLFKPATK